uniref:Uncharacterized protein n=1 Tax=Zonotrichia albicollis TaxID=44394 RepID=A0A8D2N2L2_ZONAL
MGSALGLARRTLRWRLFQSAPCSTRMALSRSSSLLNVTKANVCFPKNRMVNWGCNMSLKLG